MYGGHRLGDNLYSAARSSASTPQTGKRVWHFQTVHHDLFDYDNPAAPILADITVDGRRIKAVVQVTKQAFAFVLDRVTGKPVWPIEERPVPPSTVPGEKASPTQPFPTKPPPFDRQGLTRRPDRLHAGAARRGARDRQAVRDRAAVHAAVGRRRRRRGDKKGTIQLPGSVGGADWTGAAFDPETGMLYVPSMTNPFVGEPAARRSGATRTSAIARRHARARCRARAACR